MVHCQEALDTEADEIKLFCGCQSEYFSNNIACSRGPLTKLLWYWIEAHQCASLRLNSFRPLFRIPTCQQRRPILNLSASISIPRLMGWLISPHFTTYNSLNGKSNVKWMHKFTIFIHIIVEWTTSGSVTVTQREWSMKLGHMPQGRGQNTAPFPWEPEFSDWKIKTWKWKRSF